jgi:hypothetical protein
MPIESERPAAASSVTDAIWAASRATGASFHYLSATAQVESGFDPRASAATTSARGLFQFIEQTWLSMMKRAGSSLGYERYANAISKAASGRYEVSDPRLRDEVLELRSDPLANAMMAGALAQANRVFLSERLKRAPSEGELYLAHVLGVGGAARLISLAAGDPNGKAADHFPQAARANSTIFYDRPAGIARSLAQVSDVLLARYNLARSKR